MSTLIYVETSIPSFYFETRERTRFQAMREGTREWWDVAKVRDPPVTSEAVFAELSRAPEPKCSEATALLKPLRVLAGRRDARDYCPVPLSLYLYRFNRFPLFRWGKEQTPRDR